MKILLVAEVFPPVQPGGAGISAAELAAEMGKDHQVVVFAPRYGKFEGVEQAGNFEIFWYRNKFTVKGSLVQQKFLFFTEMTKHLAGFVRKFQPDVIHAQNLLSAPAVAKVASAHGILGAIHVRDHRFECFTTRVACPSHHDATILEFARCAEKPVYALAFPYAKLVTRSILRSLADCGRAFVISNYLKRELLRNVNMDARTVYIGVDLEKIKAIEPAKGLATRRLDYQNNVIMYAGGLHKFKGIFELLDALSQIRREISDVLLLVAGDGPDRESVRQFIRAGNLGGNVVLLGSICHQDIVSHMKSSRLVIVPSIQPEAASRVAIEGLACGKPVLGSNRGALPEIIGDAGITFEPVASSIAAAIATLLRDQAKITRLSILAQERSLGFSIGAKVSEIVRTYQEWLGK